MRHGIVCLRLLVWEEIGDNCEAPDATFWKSRGVAFRSQPYLV